MVFKRKIYNQLLSWKNNSNGKSAVLIEGARRIGKSTIVKEFAKENYKSYILIDFYSAPQSVKDAFNDILHLDDFFLKLSIEYKTTLYERNSCIIFDEVQKFPKAREAIKRLVEDGRYDYIETGSLISIKENVRDILIPSEEKTLQMYPLDFEEFCEALGEERYLPLIKQYFEKNEPLPREIHNNCMFLFKQYMLVGGMPRPLSIFIEDKKQYKRCDEEKSSILTLYRNDIAKINSKYGLKTLSIFDQLESFLSTHEKRIVFSSTNSSRKDSYSESYFWLEDSKICNACYLCNDPHVGLSMNENRSFVKMYMGDTGLLVSKAFNDNSNTRWEVYSQIINDKLSINKGMLFENVIAQILNSNGHKLFFYSHYSSEKGRNDIEVDFILSSKEGINSKIIPIEVKSTKRYKTESLTRFINKYKNRISKSYIIHPKNLSIKDGIICIPPYMTFLLK